MLAEGKHYNKQLEREILGVLLMEPNRLYDIRDWVRSSYFYVDIHQLIYQVMLNLLSAGKPVDMISVMSYLMREEGVSDIEGATPAYYLTRLTNNVTSGTSLLAWCASLHELYVARRLFLMTNGRMNGQDNLVSIQTLRNELMELELSRTAESVTLADGVVSLSKLQQEVANHPQGLMGVTTGLQSLDNWTGGFVRGGIYILGARPSMGKTALMGKMVLGAALQGHHVGVLELEMSLEQLTARFASIVTDVSYARIIRDDFDQLERDRFQRIINEQFSKLPIHVAKQYNMTISMVEAFARRLKASGKLDILFIDYLQLVIPDNTRENREQQVSNMSRRLKVLAMELGIPIVLLSQLNRESENRNNRRPRLSDLRESGSLEQDADGAMLLHRDWVAEIYQDEQGNSTEHKAQLIVAKWRNGQTGVLHLFYSGHRMKFYENEE